MTKEELAELLLGEMVDAARGIQLNTKTVLGLLESEPEPTSRLIGICNELGRENAILRNDLTAADMHTKDLEAEILKQNEYIKQLKKDRQQLWELVRR